MLRGPDGAMVYDEQIIVSAHSRGALMLPSLSLPLSYLPRRVSSSCRPSLHRSTECDQPRWEVSRNIPHQAPLMLPLPHRSAPAPLLSSLFLSLIVPLRASTTDEIRRLAARTPNT